MFNAIVRRGTLIVYTLTYLKNFSEFTPDSHHTLRS